MKYTIKIEQDPSMTYPYFASTVIDGKVIGDNAKCPEDAEAGCIRKLKAYLEKGNFETIEKEIEI